MSNGIDIKRFRASATHGACKKCGFRQVQSRGHCWTCLTEIDGSAKFQRTHKRKKSPPVAHPVAYSIALKPKGFYAQMFQGRVIDPVGV